MTSKRLIQISLHQRRALFLELDQRVCLKSTYNDIEAFEDDSMITSICSQLC